MQPHIKCLHGGKVWGRRRSKLLIHRLWCDKKGARPRDKRFLVTTQLLVAQPPPPPPAAVTAVKARLRSGSLSHHHLHLPPPNNLPLPPFYHCLPLCLLPHGHHINIHTPRDSRPSYWPQFLPHRARLVIVRASSEGQL